MQWWAWTKLVLKHISHPTHLTLLLKGYCVKHISHTDTYTEEESTVTERILDTLLTKVKNLFGKIYVPQRTPPRFEFG